MKVIRYTLPLPTPLALRTYAKLTGRLRASLASLLLGLLLAGSASLLFVRPAGAQDIQVGETSFTNEYARPGHPTMDVYVWGQVGNTGIWKVERDIDLVELLSAAQVPGLGGQNPQFNSRVLVTIYRQEGAQRSRIYQRSLKDLAAGAQDYPSLQENDIVEVRTEQHRRFSFATVTQYIGTAASLLLVALRLANP